MENLDSHQCVPITKEPKSTDKFLMTPNDLLNYFAPINEFSIKKRMNIVETIYNSQKNNLFKVKSGSGPLYHVIEYTPCCFGLCAGLIRSREIDIMDNHDNRILNIHRRFMSGCFYYPCSQDSIELYTGTGAKLGSVAMINSLWKPSYVITNANEKAILTLKSRTFAIGSCGDDIFQIFRNNEVVGGVRKISNFCKITNITSDKFSVKFSSQLNVETKALLLATCFLIERYWPKSEKTHTEKPKSNKCCVCENVEDCCLTSECCTAGVCLEACVLDLYFN